MGTSPDLTQREEPEPVCNEKLFYELVKIGLSDMPWLSYSEVVADHMITPAVASAEGARTGILQHIFSGECSANRGSRCKDFVSAQQWPQSVAIRLSDFVNEWLENVKLTTVDLGKICTSLGLTSPMTHKRRDLVAKLAGRRKSLLLALDSAKFSLEDCLQKLGSTSNIENVRAVCSAHGIETSRRCRADMVDSFFDHTTNGKCSDKRGPACGTVVNELSTSLGETVKTQIGTLKYLSQRMSSKQLVKVLDMHGIIRKEGDSKKMMKYRLGLYVQSLEKGKLKEAEAERESMARAQRLEDIRKSWPTLVPPKMKEKLVRDFRKVTSSSTLASFTCACCACELMAKERHRRTHTEVKTDILTSPVAHWNDADVRMPPTPFCTGPLAGKLLDVNGVEAVNDENIYLDLCTSCLRSLQRNVMPKHALANRLYLGAVPEELKDLTMVEESLIARARAKSWIVKLQETEGGTALPTAQRGLKGHSIVYPQEPGKLAKVLPPPIDETLTFICVIFVGTSQLTKEWLRTKAKPLGFDVRRCTKS